MRLCGSQRSVRFNSAFQVLLVGLVVYIPHKRETFSRGSEDSPERRLGMIGESLDFGLS